MCIEWFHLACLKYDILIRDQSREGIVYTYFGTRLMKLSEALEGPNPPGYMDKSFERKSGARRVTMATLTGVIIGVIFGYSVTSYCSVSILGCL